MTLKIGDRILIKAFDGYGRYGGCYWKQIKRYVKEVGEDYIIVNLKADFSGKRDLKIRCGSDNYIVLGKI